LLILNLNLDLTHIPSKIRDAHNQQILLKESHEREISELLVEIHTYKDDIEKWRFRYGELEKNFSYERERIQSELSSQLRVIHDEREKQESLKRDIERLNFDINNWKLRYETLERNFVEEISRLKKTYVEREEVEILRGKYTDELEVWKARYNQSEQR
jgi:hypothetical protein